MKPKKFIFFFLFIILSRLCSGQDFPETTSRKARKIMANAESYFQHREYDNAIQSVKQVLTLDSNWIKAWVLLAEISTETAQYKKAIHAYQQVIKLDSTHFPHTYYLLGKLELKEGFYQQSFVHLNTYLKKGKNQSLLKQAKVLSARAVSADSIAHLPYSTILYPISGSINSSNDEYINAITADEKTIVFTRHYKNNTVPVEQILSYSDDDGTTQFFPEEIISSGTVGALSINNDASVIQFALCNTEYTMGSCDIWELDLSKDTKPKNMGRNVNSSAWDSQPASSSDGKTLYFSSTRPGGMGGSDIWYCKKNEHGVWGDAINLGSPVNTSKNEMAPFIHFDNQTLYFSSDGHVGLGGSDLYMTKIKNGRWQKPKNLGYPINNAMDNINLIINPAGNTGYISSYSDSLGYDIYKFNVPQGLKPIPQFRVKGIVVDNQSHTPLEAEITISWEREQIKTQTFKSDTQGNFIVLIPQSVSYFLNITKQGYLFYSEKITPPIAIDTCYEHYIVASLRPIKTGAHLPLFNISFKTNEALLLDESKYELTQLLDFLNNNTDVRIRIEGHTDNTGTTTHNYHLSINRAKSVYNYLINNNIPKHRLTYIGLGDTQPIGNNKTEQGRAMNRRTVITVL